jgi:hypothetical protein
MRRTATIGTARVESLPEAAPRRSPKARGRKASRATLLRAANLPARGPFGAASGPFVAEALRLVRSVDESLSDLVGRGYGIVDVAENAHAARVRLETMLNTEIDEAEALQATGDWTFVKEEPARDGGATPAAGAESEVQHDE